MTKPGIAEAVLHLSVIREQQQPFAVAVQAAHRVNRGHGNIVLKRGNFSPTAELGEHAVGLIEQQVTIGQFLRDERMR